VTHCDLTSAQWNRLTGPLRRYAPPAMLADWDHDFEIEISDLAALFKDQETPEIKWSLTRFLPLLQELLADDSRLAGR